MISAFSSCDKNTSIIIILTHSLFMRFWNTLSILRCWHFCTQVRFRMQDFYILLLLLLPKWKSEYFFHHWFNVQFMSQDRTWQLAGTAHFQTVSTELACRNWTISLHWKLCCRHTCRMIGHDYLCETCPALYHSRQWDTSLALRKPNSWGKTPWRNYI